MYVLPMPRRRDLPDLAGTPFALLFRNMWRNFRTTSGVQLNDGQRPSAIPFVGETYMWHLLCILVVSSTLAVAQQADSSPEKEEAIQRTVAEKKLAKEDVQCGNYFWISKKTRTTFLYYFFGSTEWGQGKMGYYRQSLYHVAVNDDKDPPTVQRMEDAKGNVTEVRVQMSGRELAASSACFSER
jgi:hypothetical protein